VSAMSRGPSWRADVATTPNGPVHDAVVIPKMWDGWAGITVHLLCEEMPRAFRWIDTSGEGDRCPNCARPSA